MKTFRRFLSLVSAIVLVATMLSCAFTTAFADSTLDAELAALTRQGDISEKFNVVGGTNGLYIQGRRLSDVTATSQNTFNLWDNFVYTYEANYNYNVNGANNELHYTSFGDFKFAIDMGVKNVSSVKYKLIYGQDVIATYDTGLTVGVDNLISALSCAWDLHLKITIAVNHGVASVNSQIINCKEAGAVSIGNITWTLADGSTSTTVALPESYAANGVNVVMHQAKAPSLSNTNYNHNVFMVGAQALTIKYPFSTVDDLNTYLANVDVDDAAAVEVAKYYRNWACDGTSGALQESIVPIGGYTAPCVHDYTSTTTATCTEDGVRTYVCLLCGDTYTEDQAALGHTESTVQANYTKKTVCTVCNELLEWKYLGRTSNYKVVTTDLDTNAALSFDSVEYYVDENANDKLVLSESWADKVFSYTIDGAAVTGKINSLDYKLNGTTVHTVDTTVANDTYTFTTAGKYSIYGTLTDIAGAEGVTYPDQTILMGSVTVKDFVYTDYAKKSLTIEFGKNNNLDNVVIGNPSTNAFFLKANGTETETLYYGDTFSCNNWWTNYKYTITIDGVVYKGHITKFQYRNAYNGAMIGPEAYVWNGNAGAVNSNVKELSQTGLWYINGTIEGLVSVEDENVKHDTIYNIPLGSFKVKTYQGDTHVHVYEGTVVKEATCTQPGSMHYTCECGEEDYYSEIPALGHNYTSQVTVEPTCETEGVKTYTCTRGDSTYTEAIPVTDCDYVDGYCRFCGEREPYEPTAAEWKMSFVDANGNSIDNVSTAEGEFWMVVSLTNYADLIGEMNLVMEDGAIDTINSTYDRTIAFATTLISLDGTKVMGVRDTNNKIIYTTPYAGATLITNYDTEDGMLKVVFQSDDNAGCTFSVGASNLNANNGELFRIKLTSLMTEEGAIDFKFAEESKLVSSSVALINKATAGEWEAGVNYASELEFDGRGYDTIYKMNVTQPTITGPTYVETLTIPNKNVKFESDYTLGLYVSTSVFNSYKTVYIKAEKACFDGNTPIDPEVVTLTKAIDYNASLKVFEYAGFAAKEMSSVVKATVWAVDEAGNEYYGPEIEYSLRDYAQNQIGKTTKPLFKTMMVDFLNYGAAAQTYFSYNTNDLANANIAEHQDVASPERTYVDSKAGTEETSYAIDFTNFNLEYVNKINIAVVTKTSISDEKLAEMKESWYAIASYTDFNGVAQSVRLDLSNEANFGKVSGYWAVMFNGLASKEMSTPVTVTLYDGEGVQQSNSATYSIETYAAGKVNGTNVKLANLAKSMMKFGDGAAAYFA